MYMCVYAMFSYEKDKLKIIDNLKETEKDEMIDRMKEKRFQWYIQTYIHMYIYLLLSY